MGRCKPTILLGAGAVLDLNVGAPKTADITQRIVQSQKYDYYTNPMISSRKEFFTAITKIYHRMEEMYPEEPNFEHLFHVLEMLVSYSRVWFCNNCNSDIYPAFAPFVTPVANIIAQNEWENLSSLISQCQLDIMEMINEYDERFRVNKDVEYECKLYKDFWNKFSDFNLFNLNYDTTVEQSLSTYCDGFVDCGKDYQKFDPRILYDAKRKYKICHLHGCIVYNQKVHDLNDEIFDYKSDDMFKWHNYGVVKTMLEHTMKNNSPSQSGETFCGGPILTGLRKTDKINIAPCDYYYHYLNKSILENRSLFIVGYSFGDLYINNLLEKMNLLYGNNKRIVVIAKHDLSNKNFNKEKIIKKMLAASTFELKSLEDEIQDEGVYTSTDGCVKLFENGFNSAIKKYGDKIVDFLEN